MFLVSLLGRIFFVDSTGSSREPSISSQNVDHAPNEESLVSNPVEQFDEGFGNVISSRESRINQNVDRSLEDDSDVQPIEKDDPLPRCQNSQEPDDRVVIQSSTPPKKPAKTKQTQRTTKVCINHLIVW